MSAPDNPAHALNIYAEAAVATSLETSSTEGSSGQELALDSEGPTADIRDQSGSSADVVNGESDTGDQDLGSQLSSAASSAELSDQVSGIIQAAAGTDQEQSGPVNMFTPSDHVTQPLNQEPVLSRIPENARQEEGVPTNSTVIERETQPRVTDEAARLSASVNIPPPMQSGYIAPVPHRSEPVHSKMSSRNRTPRSNSLPQGQRSNNSQYDSAEIVRLNAQILKIRDDLAAERTKNLTQRQQMKSEQRQYLEATFSNMVTDLLHEQIDILARKANIEARERDVLFREQRAAQLESFLAEGQRQLVYGLDEHHMNAVQLDHIGRETDLKMRKHLTDREAKLAVKSEELRLRASAQEKREELYKIMVRELLEAEIKKSVLSVEDEYKRGFKDGKEAGKQEFLKGYHACHRAQATLSMFRKSEMVHGAPELDFLFDPAHPGNMFNMGVQIGKLELHGATESASPAVKATIPAPEAESNHRSDVTEAKNDTIEEAAEAAVDQNTVGMSYAAPAFARPTLAAELRGPSHTYNGQIVLANNDALRTLTPETTGDSVVQNNQEGPNLIDLV
ncbi:carbonate dehydratase [Curvularia clavata]|uniref:Carbonate dehydratase n=1 Tax=Curvularia clavata TaxID=95742 RepID=A0A9Q9DU26_CURCL|nr:carbonate dehydratase [Curvularia clavata]